MREILLSRLKKNFDLYNEFVSNLEESLFSSKLANLPSNTIGQQLWCVIGARESHLNAIKNDKWVGFECSLDYDLCSEKDQVSNALQKSSVDILQYLKSIDFISETKANFILDLIEHESRHQGQLIRYIYGLKQNFPESWKESFSLD